MAETATTLLRCAFVRTQLEMVKQINFRYQIEEGRISFRDLHCVPYAGKLEHLKLPMHKTLPNVSLQHSPDYDCHAIYRENEQICWL